MKHTECKDCKFREGNCGNHFISMRNGSTNYDIPSLSACDQYGNCCHFEPTEKPKVDLISREALKEKLNARYEVEQDEIDKGWNLGIGVAINLTETAPTVERQYFPPCEDCHKKMDAIRRAYDKAVARPAGEWIPITYRPMTEEAVKRVETYFGLPLDEEDKKCFSCPMPEHGQEILISTEWGVSKDICLYDCDEGYFLDERGDWEDVDAWMPLPEKYDRADIGGENNGR